MTGYLLRTAVTALGLWLADALIPGIAIQGTGTLLLAALIMGLINGLLRPVVIFFTLPITIVTFGLFLLIINAALFGLTAAVLDGFEVSGFFAALFGWFIVSLVSAVASWTIGPNGRYQVLSVERRRNF